MKKILLFLFIIFVLLATAAWIRYGGGDEYPDLTTTPLLESSAIEEVLAYDEPIGNVAVSASGRIFFTVHPEARPRGNRLLEYVNGASVPYPNVQLQLELFDTPLGMIVDREDRLWIIDHGNHGLRTATLFAFDLATGEILRIQEIPKHIAPAGSLLQDLQVSSDSRTIIIADESFWRKSPAIIVYDVETGDMRRVLEGHESVSAENYLIRAGDKKMSFLGGIVNLRGGINGIALGHEWLYYGAISNSGLYRIRLSDLRNEKMPDHQLAARIERYATKPLSDGFSIDIDGNVYVTDVEHGAVYVVGANRKPVTLIQSSELRWPDALSFGPEGWLYVADSALAELVLAPREYIHSQRPYKIFRFQPGVEGTPGQ